MAQNPQHVLLFHHFRRVLEAAAAVRIDVAPLKGAHLITTVYPRDEDRGMLADVDFLVRAGDFERLLRLMEELGFAGRMDGAAGVRQREFYEAGMTLALSSGGQLLFEPHRSLVQPARHSIDYEELWARSVSGSFEGAPCRVLANEDHVLHGVIHMLTHRFSDLARPLRDLELLVSVGELDWDALLERARTWECARATWLALVLLDEACSALGVGARAAEVAPPWPVRRALRLLVPDGRGFRFAATGLRREQAVLWPLLFDSKAQAARFVGYYSWLRARDAVERVTGRSSTGPAPWWGATGSG